MSESDDFLTRWSRRKQEAAQAKRVKDEPAPPPPDKALPETAGEPFDVSALPPIDSITALSDVRDFLRAGVPAELARAALRRAWSADPAIRDFVGLSENAWDFTAPDSIPGFGPLEDTPEIRALVDRIVGNVREAAQALPDEPSPVTQNAAGAATSPQPQVTERASPERRADDATGDAPADAATPRGDSLIDIAAQNESDAPQRDHPRPRRARGAALPR